MVRGILPFSKVLPYHIVRGILPYGNVIIILYIRIYKLEYILKKKYIIIFWIGYIYYIIFLLLLFFYWEIFLQLVDIIKKN